MHYFLLHHLQYRALTRQNKLLLGFKAILQPNTIEHKNEKYKN